MSNLHATRLKVWCGPLLASIVLACGGAVESERPPETMRDCGPNGVFHGSASGAGHCDCESGYTERDGSCEAVAPPPATGLDCGPHGMANGSGCDCEVGYTQTGADEARTCEAIPSCEGPDDDYEPNSQPTDARLLSVTKSSLYACPADHDWFVFAVAAGDEVSVEITFDGAAVDLDLFVFDPGATEPQSRLISADNNRESVAFVAGERGTASILVAPYGIGEGGYEITVDVDGGAAPMCAAPGASCGAAADCCSGHCHSGHCH